MESVYAALRRHPAPGMGRNTQGVVDGQISIAQLGYDAKWDDLGPVRHTVLESQLTVINSTMSSHRLHQGDVVRQVYVDGGSVWIGTYGTGTGPYPWLNERLSNPLWSAVDSTIRYDINLGYRP